MRTKLIFASLILLVSFTSCKKEVSKDEVKPIEVETKKNNFQVTLTATVKTDDNFQLYYSEDEYEVPFKEENSVWMAVKANDNPQDIVFNLPEDAIPNYIRIDFGTNEGQKEIIIKNFKMKYYSKSFEAKDSLFFNYFIPNECIKVLDKKNSIIQNIKSKDGKYDPLFYSEKALYDQIQLIVK
ncbi:hypothetical protein ACHRVW_01685 [Flavobacterium collinsii]|jgi:hypothetical protein|uniref:Lipoprotein n=1 Tax=Flavobacterium collinsii TaxID=1114861 RepID=A0A9W4TFE0_9FLAO|nr:hypothetical protein [Flavobacterium collinsii]GIQ58878.1 hypothetical protein Flavo103_20140 [Flavobacterium collinsii]CAA9202550.1 hypothetical protein FLACOL7796_04348 [Flavobacterium collinsii]CAI2766040.1 conserved exported protein of unknown function [Flavobacterium collinsii]